MSLKAVVDEFTARLSALVESQAVERARAAILGAFGVPAARTRDRPPKAASTAMPVAKKTRKKVPRQLCPVPSCKNAAAPVFGLVCVKHKDVAKLKARKYREARRARKHTQPRSRDLVWSKRRANPTRPGGHVTYWCALDPA